MTKKKTMALGGALTFLILLVASGAAVAAPPLSGAIFTTDSTCTGVDLNIYGSKDDVYIDGGPKKPGSAGLPSGYYYVRVTEPNGTLLGTSIGSGNETPVFVKADGEFDGCYQLSAILIHQGLDGDGNPVTIPGYADTSNPGGEYKVWVSNDRTFLENSSKTDNFKVKENPPPQPPELIVKKFYDANANGQWDKGDTTLPDEATLLGWEVDIYDNVHIGPHSARCTTVDIFLDPGEYGVAEGSPVETNWFHTTPILQIVDLAEGGRAEVDFGNVCVGAGGGLTLGFWSNKNGQGVMTRNGMGAELAFLASLNLRDGRGNNFDPTTYTAFRNWLLNATATNMAYMLSAQLAAMELNVANGFVNANALIYAPGASSSNSAGFGSVGAIMAEANTELGLHGLTLDGSEFRSYQEALKNALDNANNNRTFVQASACAYTFADGLCTH